MATLWHEEARYGGLSPHSCIYCAQIIIVGTGNCITVRRKSSNKCESTFTYGEVEQASHHGCPLFKERLALFQKEIASKYPASPRDAFSLEFYVALVDDRDLIDVGTVWQQYGGDIIEGKHSLYIHELEGNDIPEFKPPQPLNEDPGSRWTLETTHKWFHRCLNSHEKCSKVRKRQQSTHALPPRLLEIRPERGEIAVLCDTRAVKHSRVACNQYMYAALSYSWGGVPQSITSTTETIDKLRRGIPISQLSTTIQDAIRVVRDMGIPYIWVDALCIVQNDDENKEQENVRIKNVFARAVVVISAATAKSCQQGFLQPRNLSRLLKAIYKIPYYPNENGDQKGDFVLSEGKITGPQAREEIDTRVWTLEEHLQQVPLLRFGSRQVSWKCEESLEVDGGLGMEDEETVDEIIRPHWKDYPSLKENLRHNEKASSICSETWWEFVMGYTAREASDQKDVLRGISYAAEKHACNTQGQCGAYYAGLWAQDLPRGLLWFKPRPMDDTDTTRLNPSWSWASLTGAIIYAPELCTRKSDVKVISCNMELHDLTRTYDRVISGTLTIEAKIRPLISYCLASKGLINTVYCASGFRMPLNLYWDRAERDFSSTFCLEVIPAGEFNAGSCGLGLLLCLLDSGTYERVGYYECLSFLDTKIDRMQALQPTTGRITIV